MTTNHDPWTDFIDQVTDEEGQQQLIADNREVADYMSKPLVKRLQYDGWLNYPEGDSFMRPDADGDVLMSTTTRERHRSKTSVRIWIDPDADRADITRLLTKLVDWYQEGAVIPDAAGDLPRREYSVRNDDD